MRTLTPAFEQYSFFDFSCIFKLVAKDSETIFFLFCIHHHNVPIFWQINKFHFISFHFNKNDDLVGVCRTNDPGLDFWYGQHLCDDHVSRASYHLKGLKYTNLTLEVLYLYLFTLQNI